MAYSVTADVQRLIKWITFGDTSKLTSSDITAIIAEVDAAIDGQIGQIYSVPVSNATDVKIVGYASARLAAYEAAKILINQAGGDLPQAVEEWKSDAEKRVAAVLERRIMLENTSRRTISTGQGIYSHTAHHVDRKERTWKIGTDQW